MTYTLFDDQWRDQLLPLTATRPVSELRIGILTIREKWEMYLDTKISSWKTEKYLSDKFATQTEENTIFINGHCCPTESIASKSKSLQAGEGLRCGELIIAMRPSTGVSSFPEKESIQRWIEVETTPGFLRNTWELFTQNEIELRADFDLLTKGRKTQPIPSTVNIIGRENVFIEEGAKLNFATINAEKGPVYLGKNSEIMEGTLIRGPLALCENSVINMGAKIYGATTIGPGSKVGGEISNSVIQGYSNKGHDGFLGNSVIGEWCNLGAGTNTSNLKNDYTEVKLWNYPSGRFLKTGQQFCGLIMGDHSKCGINTMFNSGTSIGVACNIHGDGYPRNFIPSFSNGGRHGFEINPLKTVLKTAEQVMARRGIILSETDKQILIRVFDLTNQP